MSIRLDFRTIRYWRAAMRPRPVPGRYINDEWIPA
jgi:hypothetical protein